MLGRDENVIEGQTRGSDGGSSDDGGSITEVGHKSEQQVELPGPEADKKINEIA